MILIYEYRPEKITYPGQSVYLVNGKKHENIWEGIVCAPSGTAILIELDGISTAKSGPVVEELSPGATVYEKTVRNNDPDSRIVEKMKTSQQFAIQSKNEKHAKFIDRQITWQRESERQISDFLEILDIETQYIKKLSDKVHIRQRLLEIDTLRKNVEQLSTKSAHPNDLMTTVSQTMYDLFMKKLENERLGAKNPELISILQYKLSRLYIEISTLKRQRKNDFGCGFSDGEILNDPAGRSFVMKNGRLVETDQKIDAVTYPSVMFTGCDIAGEPREEPGEKKVSQTILTKFTEIQNETQFFFAILDEKSMTLPVDRGGFQALTFKNGAFEFVTYKIDPDLLFAVKSGSIQHMTSGMFLEIIDRKVVAVRQRPEYDLNIEKTPSDTQFLYEISKFGLTLAKTPDGKMGLKFGAPPSNLFIVPVAKKLKS